MDINKVGNFIKILRENKGWTQGQLAAMLNVTDKAISKWESGAGLPDTVFFPQLSKIFGVSSDELLSGERLNTNGIKTKYELALDIGDITTMETFLVNDNLTRPDEKGKTFLYYVVKKNKSLLIPFCLNKALLKINDQGIVVDHNGSSEYDKEITKMIIENYLTLDWRRKEVGTSQIIVRKYSKEELKLIIEIAKTESAKLNRNFELGYIYWFFTDKTQSVANPYIVELIDIMFMELKLHQWIPVPTFMDGFSKILTPRNLKLNDKLIDYFYRDHIIFIEKSIIAKGMLSEYGFQKYLKTQLQLGSVDRILDDMDIYEQYKIGNWEFIEKVIDRKNTSTELYSIKNLRQKTSIFTPPHDPIYKEITIPGKESEYKMAKFFNEDYPDVCELLIRKNKGIPENRPSKNLDGELSIESVTSGMSAKFIRVLFESLINKVVKLENEVDDLKKMVKK